MQAMQLINPLSKHNEKTKIYIYFLYFSFVTSCVCLCVLYMWVEERGWIHLIGARDQTKVVRLGSKHLCPQYLNNKKVVAENI